MKPGGKGLAIATDSDHDPRDNVAKNLLLHDGRKPLQRLAAWFYQVYNYIAVTRSQDAGRNLDNTIKGGRVADRSDASRPMASKRPEVHGFPE